MAVKTHEIYKLDAIKAMRTAALAREREVAQRLHNYLKAEDKQSRHHVSLRGILENSVFNHFTPIEKVSKGNFTALSNNIAQLDFEYPVGSGKMHTKYYTLTPKQWQELYSLQQQQAAPNELLGIFYEYKTIEELINAVVPQVGTLVDLNHFDVIAGNNIGKMDAYITFPSTSSKKDSNGDIKYTKSLFANYKIGVDVKSNSYRFGVGSVGQMGTNYLNQLRQDLMWQKSGKSKIIQGRLFPKESLETIIALNILKWKIKDQNYPIFLGATDGDFVLSSELLDHKFGTFEVEYVPQIQGQITRQAIQQAMKTVRLDINAVHQIATEAVINNIMHTSLWYNR